MSLINCNYFFLLLANINLNLIIQLYIISKESSLIVLIFDNVIPAAGDTQYEETIFYERHRDDQLAYYCQLSRMVTHLSCPFGQSLRKPLYHS